MGVEKEMSKKGRLSLRDYDLYSKRPLSNYYRTVNKVN